MLKQFKYKEVTWIDIESPTNTEIDKIGQDYNIHPLVLNELAQVSERSKLDIYNDFIYLVLHLPSSRGVQEVDFLIGKDFVITTHYELVNSLNDFAKIFETDFTLKRSHDKIHAGFIFYYIIKELYHGLEVGLTAINRRLKIVEEKVFTGHEREMVKTLAELNRELLDCQWTMKSHREVLTSLELAGEEFFGAKFKYYLQAITGEDRRIWKMIESNREAFNDLRQTNESLLSIKTNETMRVLTVIAFTFLPLNLIGQIFGSSTKLPIFISTESDFYFSLGLMAFVFLISLWLAKSRKWL